MKPQARIQAGIEILALIMDNTRVPMDTVLGDYMRRRRYIGAKDRSVLAERAYGMMRAHARLGWWLTRTGAEETARRRMLAWLVLGEGADEKRLKDLFDGSKYAPEPLSEQEWALIKTYGKAAKLNHPEMPPDVRVECPPLYADTLRAYFGDAFEAEMQAMLKPATLDVRVNTFLASREKVQKFLEADGVKTVPTPYSRWGLRCEKKAYLARTKAFNKGWIEIQDEGSQLIAAICGAKPGMQVLDYCAGAGGKTLALAASMERKGRIVAMDTDDRRLQKGRARYKKARLADIVETRSLNDPAGRKWLRRQKGKFDLVLLDVPCTGTGTWRRNPDMRWWIYGPPLEELVEMQAAILDKVVHTLRPAGRLVYATCSLLPDENENQIKAFLDRHEGFEVMPVPIAPPPHSLNSLRSLREPSSPRRGEGNGAYAEGVSAVGGGEESPFMRLTPHRHGTDGFFAAVLTRK